MSYRGVQVVVLALVVVLAGCSTGGGGGPAVDSGETTPTVTATPVPSTATPTEAVPAISDPGTATPTASAGGVPEYSVPGDAPAVADESWFDVRRTSQYEFRVTIGETVQHLTLDVTRENRIVTAYEARIEEADGDATVVFGEAAASLPDELDTFRVMQVREGPMPRSIAQLSVLTPLGLARAGDAPAQGSLAPGTRSGVLEDGTRYTATVRGQRTVGGVACSDATFTTDDGSRFDTCLTGTGYAPYVSVDTGNGVITVELLGYSHED